MGNWSDFVSQERVRSALEAEIAQIKSGTR